MKWENLTLSSIIGQILRGIDKEREGLMNLVDWMNALKKIKKLRYS